MADQGSCREDLLTSQLVLLSEMMRSHTFPRITLGLQSGIETEVCQLNDDPSNQSRNSRYVDEPAEDYRRVV